MRVYSEIIERDPAARRGLADEMRHLRESSGARDRAGDELRSLQEKVRETSNEDVVRNLKGSSPARL